MAHGVPSTSWKHASLPITNRGRVSAPLRSFHPEAARLHPRESNPLGQIAAEEVGQPPAEREAVSDESLLSGQNYDRVVSEEQGLLVRQVGQFLSEAFPGVPENGRPELMILHREKIPWQRKIPRELRHRR